jgi:hypothetical protein
MYSIIHSLSFAQYFHCHTDFRWQLLTMKKEMAVDYSKNIIPVSTREKREN